jgi:AcrR family transcriptional regulator
MTASTRTSSRAASRQRLSRSSIAATAVVIADAEGFDAVSMRRVAAALGAGTMALYRHVAGKEDLVALMHDALMGEVIVPDDELSAHWRAGLTAVARRTRAVMTAHPWAPMALQSAAFGPAAMKHLDQCMKAMAHTSMSVADKFALLALVDDYVIGHVIHAAEFRTRAELAPVHGEDARRTFDTEVAQGALPSLSALVRTEGFSEGWRTFIDNASGSRAFEQGLSILLDGAAQRWGLDADHGVAP